MFLIKPCKILPFFKRKEKLAKKEQKTALAVCSMLITFLQYRMKSKIYGSLALAQEVMYVTTGFNACSLAEKLL